MVLVVGQFAVHTSASIVSDHVSSQRSHALSTGGCVPLPSRSCAASASSYAGR